MAAVDSSSGLTFDEACEHVGFVDLELVMTLIDVLMTTRYADAEVPDESGRYLRFGRDPEPDHGEALRLWHRGTDEWHMAQGLEKAPFEFTALEPTPSDRYARVATSAKVEAWGLLRDALSDHLRALDLLIEAHDAEPESEAWAQARDYVADLRAQLRDAIRDLRLELDRRAGARDPMPDTRSDDHWGSPRVDDAFARLRVVALRPPVVLRPPTWRPQRVAGRRRRRAPLARQGARRAPPDDPDLPSHTPVGAAA